MLLLVAAAFAPLKGGTVVLGFEGFSDGTSLTTQYPGVTFTNTTVINAGISLNEFEFPPHSGTNVAFDDGGPVSIVFASPIVSFGGYFTYDEPLTLAGFGLSSDEVAVVTSAYSSNDALYGDSGSTPNEFLQINFTGGISSVTITADPGGDSFVMDDIVYKSTSVAPEPCTLVLLLTVGLGIIGIRRSDA